jgi:hypothetical protein
MINIRKAKNSHEGEPITLDEFTDWLEEIDNQPIFRSRMDKEMDYANGNQLDSDLLRKLREVGIPPAVDNIIQPALQTLVGLEVKTRKDWRITPDGDPSGQDVADALNYKLNQAERHSKADQACSKAFFGQASVGLAWVEVSREADPYKYPYRCTEIHRNEIFWDLLGKEPDTSDWRYLNRRKWMPTKVAAMMWPKHAELINRIERNWGDEYAVGVDGGTTTGLMDSWQTQRDWSVEEQQWHDSVKKRVLVHEMWYRRWVQVPTLVFHKGGKVVEYDSSNPAHDLAISRNLCRMIKATVSRVRRAYFLGPHMLDDGPSPYRHSYFGYVPFWNMREDRTGVPFGFVKAMVFPQDNLNSALSKLRWGLSAMRTERTKGAVAMPDHVFRQQIARPDADIVLDANHMSQPGARFEVRRDFQLNDQQYQLIQDARTSIERATGITAGFAGKQGTATSGLQEQTQVEQSTQALSGLMDAFGFSRTLVGEMLLDMIIEDMGSEPTTVIIEGDTVRPERTVQLNVPEVDPASGVHYLSNDVQRIKLKVALEDVPTTSSFRAQQLSVMGEAVKSMPANMQSAVMPFMVGLMDLPMKKDVIEAIKAASAQETPEAIEKRIQQAVQDALAKSGNELKAREVQIKERKADAEIAKLVAEAVQTGIKSAFGAIQSGQLIAQMPQIAPIGDILLKNAGWQPPTPEGVDPDMPMPNVSVPQGIVNPGDTSPQTPSDPASQMAGENMGINTMRSEG